MKRQLLVMGTLCSILFLGTFNWSSCTAKKEAVTATAPATESAPAEKAAEEPPSVPPFIAAIQEKIKGKENLPAEEVFENIQILKGIPAGRVLPIMRMGFSQSLGVKCSHCHEFGDWASESKPAKQVARDMWVMTGKINQELLKEIPNLQSEQPAVNCTTCHRGEVKPATNM
ncbi:MAG: c-type cytochrome [Lewinellaceae bacterium]|nr:c-type cytochrome [Phaeodactylibacter sp.]MCB0616831.1 c-type cytochrome [Phaeodactylibacter sp.]MCB9347558.1 c-type cytochrome [Lewinellaceae bacterium]